VYYFREAGAAEIRAGAVIQLEDAAILKRVYRLTAEATGPLAQAKGALTAGEVREMIAGSTHIEEDPLSVLIKFPDVWTIASR
jgi:hypothetical protein